MTLPDDVVALLDAQHGVATRTQLVNKVGNAAIVDAWFRRRVLVREHRGVGRLRGAPRSKKQALMAAVLRGGEDARADGRASCWLFGLEGFGPHTGIVVPFPRQVTGLGFESHTVKLEPADCSTVDGIPCLSAARALIEVAPLISEKALRVAFDSARRSGLLTVEWLRRRANALSTLYGARLVLAMLGRGDGDKDGEGERALADFLGDDAEGLEWGVTDVVPQRKLDAFDREALLVLEYDGRDHHVLPTDRDADGLRDIEVRAVRMHGIPLEVIRITKGMIDGAPHAVRLFIRNRRQERRAEVAAARATEKHAHMTETR